MKTLLLLSLVLVGNQTFASAPAEKAAESLYSIAAKLQGGEGDCGHGSCFATLTKVMCTWANNPQGKNDNCSFVDSEGKERTISGREARRLTKAIFAVEPVETDASAGTAGFAGEQDVNCAEKREIGAGQPRFSYECQVAPSEAPVDGE